MNAAALACELVYGTADPSERERSWLRAHGVPDAVIRADPGPVSVARIRLSEDGLYEPSEDGEKSYVHPVWEAAPFAGDPTDAIAWQPSDPSRWWLRTGAATVLGISDMRAAFVFEQPLHLHRSPLAWLAAFGVGTVILDWRSARLDLLELSEIIGEDFDHGVEIEQRLRGPVPPRPKIRVPRAQGVAA